MADILQDFRYAVRSARRSPGFATLAILILALGIGANTAVFSVVNGVLLKPLAYRDPDRIVTLSSPRPGTPGDSPTAVSRLVSIPNARDWHDQSSSFDAMAYYFSHETSVMPGSTAEYGRVARISPEFFRVFAVEPIAGRLFTPEELKEGSGGGGALMISYVYWQNHLGGDPRVLEQKIRVYGRTLPIAGVLPPGFRFPDQTDLWYLVNTISPEATAEFRGAQNYLVVGRLKPGVPLKQAQTEMISIGSRLERQYPETNKGWTIVVTRMRDDMVGDVRTTLYLLLGAVSLVLLIACGNTATLLLGKATARRREIALRAALGAGSRRILRQLITESLLLAFLAGALGLLLAFSGSKALVALAPANLPRLSETGIDRSVLAFTFAISIATSLLFGLIPAVRGSNFDLSLALKQSDKRSMGGGRMIRLHQMLVVAEIALAVLLLSGAGLLIKSFVALLNVPLGFRPENVLVMKATVPAPIPVANQFFREMLAQIPTLPGVVAAGATMAPPGQVGSAGPYFLDHLPPQIDWSAAPTTVNAIVAPGTFAALGIPLKSGRDFRDSDTSDSASVAVVNEALVRRSAPGENPLGRTVFCPFDSSKGMTIIGVVGDVRQRGPARESTPECYMPYLQHGYNGSTLSIVVRTAGDPVALTATLRRLAHERAPNVPMKFTPMETMVAENVATPRFRTLLFGLFAALAVCLAMAGVYGVTAYAVGQRTNEIGLRMALGASTGSVLRLILGRGLMLAGLGLAIGLSAAVEGTQLLASLLFQVQPNDPQVYVAVAVLVGLVTIFATLVPARRASRIDPLTALREE